MAGSITPTSGSAATSAPFPSAKPVDFEVYLPLRNKVEMERLLEAQQTPGDPEYHKWLTPAEFAARFGPTAQSMKRAQASLQAKGFVVTQTRARSFHVAGDSARFATAFGARLQTLQPATGPGRLVVSSRVVLPTALQQEGAKIVAFNAIRPRRPMSRRLATTRPQNRYGHVGSYWFTDLKQAYDYPSYKPPTARTPALDGAGVRVAVLMSDLLYPGDVAAMFDHEKFTAITGKPAPTVTTVLVDGGGVTNGNGSFEASLDVQQVLGGAPGAPVTLISIPDLSDQSIADGYNYIVNDNSYDAVNSSFGECELEYFSGYNNGVDYTYLLDVLHEIFAQGNLQGITFVASSGDQAGPMCPGPNYAFGVSSTFGKGVSTPADDPNVTAVGGGNLITTTSTSSLTSAYHRESAFADPLKPYDIYSVGRAKVSGGYWGAGGGVGAYFAQPTYQSAVYTRGGKFRTVPDVGMEVGGLGYSGEGCDFSAISCSADDTSVFTAFGVGVGGDFYPTIGTSVSSPEFVGALALYIQRAGVRQGNINPYLYSMGAAQTAAGGQTAPPEQQYFHRAIPGSNGVRYTGYPSHNYNYINGNGTPDVRKLFGLTDYAPAGRPQTATNP